MDYIYIRAWGQHMGSFPYYIRDQLATAHEDKAPGNAIYKRDDGIWATIDDIATPSVRTRIEKLGAAIQGRENPLTRKIV